MTDDLDVLAPAGASVGYRGETIEVTPLTIGMLPKLVRTARPVIDKVLELESLPDDDSGELVTLVLDLVEHHGDQVFEAASICTGKPVDWLQDAGIDEFVVLVKTVFEVNRDFFTRRLVPLLGGLPGSLGKPASGSGQTALSS